MRWKSSVKIVVDGFESTSTTQYLFQQSSQSSRVTELQQSPRIVMGNGDAERVRLIVARRRGAASESRLQDTSGCYLVLRDLYLSSRTWYLQILSDPEKLSM